MPTSYTADVQSGQITEFKDFALGCARAFGALITMRDDPADAAVPDEFVPDQYYADRLREATAELAALNELTSDEIAAKAEQSNAERLAWHREYIAGKQEERARYEAMLEKVRQWVPPSSDHEELKKFMIQQLDTSIDFDCSTRYAPNEPKPQTPTEWLNQSRDDLTRRIQSAEKSSDEEIERCAKRTAWVRLLKASLQGTSE